MNSASAATAIPVTVTPAQPWTGEIVKLAGRAAPKGRTVMLQQRVGSRWTVKARMRTGARGGFAFRVRATSTRASYRVVAPRTRINGTTYPSRASTTKYIKGRTPSVRLEFAPAPVGRRISGDSYYTPGRVAIAPARPGAAVLVQRWTSSGWATVKSGVQNRAGVLHFQMVPGSFTYRAAASTPGSTIKYYSASVRPAIWAESWEDDMGRPVLGPPDPWKPRGVGVRGARRVCSTTGENNTSYTTVDGVSLMRLRLTKDQQPVYGTAKCPYGTYRNAMVGTDTTLNDLRYGVYAARVRFQAPRGMHGAFWLQSAGTPEIDVAEYFGNGRTDGGIASFLHPRAVNGVTPPSVGGVLPAAKAEFVRQRTTPSAGYHVYSVERTPTSYVFRIDGVETMRTSKYLSADQHYLVLSLLASDWELKDLTAPISQAYMDVDWVRVYRRP